MHTPEVRALARDLAVSLDGAEPILGLLKVVDALSAQGYVILVKWDGEREPENGDNGRYTAMISGGDLGGDYFRRDDETLVQALNFVLAEYSRRQQHRPPAAE